MRAKLRVGAMALLAIAPPAMGQSRQRMDDDKGRTTSTPALTSTSMPGPRGPVPTATGTADMTTLLRLVDETSTAYRNGANQEFVRQAAVDARSERLCREIPLRVERWPAALRSVSTARDGQVVVVEFALASNVMLRSSRALLTSNISEDPAAILAGSEPGRVAAAGTIGQRYFVTGRFIPNPDRHCFREMSLTTSGMMTSPEFLFRFEEIARGELGREWTNTEIGIAIGVGLLLLSLLNQAATRYNERHSRG